MKVRGRHIAIDVEGTPTEVQVHTADVRDRDGAPDAMLRLPGKAPNVTRLWADSGGNLRAGPAGMSRCRRLAWDSGRTLESPLAWVQLAVCRFPVRRLAR